MRQTVVGVFDGFEAARHAAELLRQRGIDDDDIHVTAADDDASSPATTSHDTHDKGILQRIKEFFSGAADDDDVGLYSEHVRRGGAVVAVDVEDEPHVDTARQVLEQAGAVDIDDRAAEWRASGWSSDTTMDDDRYPDALSGGGTAGTRTGLGTRAGVGGGAGMPMGATSDPGYAADPDDLIARGRGREGLSAENAGGVGTNLPPGSTGLRDGEPLENRPGTVPDTEVRRGLSSSVTPGSGAQTGSSASADQARRSALLSSRSQDDDGSVQGTTGGLSTGGRTARATGVTGGGSEEVIPVVREDVQIGKRAMKAGGVRVYTRVVEDRVHESVDLREERARVDRRPVDRPAGTGDLQERSVEIDETVEKPVVQKTARVVEEVVVGKDVGSRRQEIDETVRHTEVEVKNLAGDAGALRDTSAFDATAFRSDFDSRYASAGGRWEDYEPAYRYGHTLRSDARYRGRDWNAVEADARADWELQHPGATGASTWERMKGAVRHAWERAKD